MSTDEKQSLAERLRWAREQAGLSQGQVARSIGVHRPTISQIELGERNVRVEELRRFADLYDVDEQWLMGGEPTVGRADPRVQLAARALSKLKPEDLDKILKLLQVLRTPGSGGRE